MGIWGHAAKWELVGDRDLEVCGDRWVMGTHKHREAGSVHSVPLWSCRRSGVNNRPGLWQTRFLLTKPKDHDF